METTYSPNIVIEKCEQAGLSFWTASKIALELKDRLQKRMSEDDINLQIANALRNVDADSAFQFESYHSIKVRTSKNVLEAFDRSKITNSLVKETRIPRPVAEEISEEVETDIRRLQLRNVSTPLIREMVNTTLIQKRLEDVKMQYTRIGIPVYDIKETIEREKQVSPYDMNQHFGNTILEEYTLTRVLPHTISDAYLNSDIFIHGLEQFITSPMTLQNDLRVFLKNGIFIEDLQRTGPAKKAEVAATHAVRVLSTSRKYVGKGVSADFFNIFMAPYVRRMNRKDIEQICQAFLYELNKNYFTDHSFVVNFDMEIPDFLKDADAIGPGGKISGTYSDYADEAEKFLKIFIETMQKGDYSGTPFRLPEISFKSYKKSNLKLLEDLKQPYYLINQTDKNQSIVYTHALTSRDESGLRTGIAQSVSINLPKFTRVAKDEKSFYSILEHYLNLSRDIALVKKDMVKKRLYKTKSLSFLSQFFDDQEYIKFDDFNYLISFVGLPQASQLFLGKKEYDKDCANFTERIVRFSLRKFRQYKTEDDLRFSLGETGEKKELERFSRQNKALGMGSEISPKIIPDSFEEKEDYYKTLQPLFEGGAFFDMRDNNFSKSKDFLFLRRLG